MIVACIGQSALAQLASEGTCGFLCSFLWQLLLLSCLSSRRDLLLLLQLV
jgi:hypothetical protein